VDILKVLVGSQAHGLATPQSDHDYRGVFVTPTSELLSLGETPRQTRWEEGRESDTSWEVGKFLFMALKCNPTILECFVAPRQVGTTMQGQALQALFPYIWTPQGVADAFIGYGQNQRKKFLDDKDQRSAKYAVAYLRVLYQAERLLWTHSLVIDMRGTEVEAELRRWRVGNFTPGEVIQTCRNWEERIRMALRANSDIGNPQYAPARVNAWLLTLRRECW
jgi:predicted nucleotidyltransferase